MSHLELFIEQTKKQQDIVKLAFGNSTALLRLAEIQWNNQNKFNMLDIFDPQKRLSMIINENWSKNFQSESYKSIESALMPLRNISNITDSLNKQLETFNSSQVFFKSSIELLTKSYNEKLFKGFNSFIPAISEITKSFLGNIKITDDNVVEELEIINTVTNRINEVSENFIEDSDNAGDIQKYLLQVNDALINLQNEVISLQPKNGAKWLNTIVNFISIIGFIALFYNPLNEKNDKLLIETNKKVNEIDKKLANVKEQVFQNAEDILSKNSYKCLRPTKVFLKPDKNSKKIGQIKQGQRLKIIEVRRKYCCIAILPKNNQDGIVGYILINDTNFNN